MNEKDCIRVISAEEITACVERLFVSANKELPKFVTDAIYKAKSCESCERAASVLAIL